MKYFGTDGIRRKGEFFLEENFLYRFAAAVSKTFFVSKVVIGRDTRNDGLTISRRLAQSFRDLGIEVFDLGIVPTPEVCYFTRDLGCAMGIMISASHNPPEYNGLKVVDSRGIKITEEQEFAIEKQIDNPMMTLDIHFADYHLVDGASDYVERVTSGRQGILTGQNILLDCAHGSATVVAERVFKILGANVQCISGEQLGDKINSCCGATCIDNIRDKSNDYDLALAFDGDADRVLAARKGNVLDGDDILYNLVLAMGARLVAVTVMSNYGLDLALNARGVDVIRVSVGDKYIQDAVLSGRAEIGAEQSGHIILSDEFCTGDGILAGALFAEVAAKAYKPINKLAQKLINVSAESKSLVGLDFSAIEERVKADGGRILIRPSGTESVIRVLVEAKSQEKADIFAIALVDMIQNGI